MALKSNFNEASFNRDTQDQAEKLYDKILNEFIMAGEQFVIDAKGQGQDHSLGQYQDRTTNLRNSIGYYIYYKGDLVTKNVLGTENMQAVQDVINPIGFQLIAIAGMNYASHVESKGYNVISYQSDICMINLATYLEKLEVLEQGYAARIEEKFVP